ncbi:peptidoglycan-binding protein [Streptomyces sp. CBMA152]|uniref:peptidoglycan-binding domain-containing protein n=1 Tax=Streptomyces sp. CBMA152 TaxID=1896312 RepID=UPI0016603AEE|nr:peptidoglycan-binding domain-containing protein [Streptomyces sp. CBMA152]MBD0746635.1 hypothetical protein [Streptomyces sp. CBMA152]
MRIPRRTAALATTAAFLVGTGSLATATNASAATTYTCHYSYDIPKEYEYAGYYSGNSYVPTYGDWSTPAIEAQCLLNRLHYGLAVDGIYGQHTHDAVQNFQASYGIPADGYVGPQTWPLLRVAAYHNW